MKRKLLVGAMALVVSSAGAQTGSPYNTQSLYYEIGGGDAIIDPLNTNAIQGVGLGADVQALGSVSCDMWDGVHLNLDTFRVMVEDHLDQTVDSLQRSIVASLVGATTGFATAALQRAMPGMYDWSQNINAQVSAKIETAKMTCDSVLEDMNNNVNPFEGWIRASTGFDWSNSLATARGIVQNPQPDAEPNILTTQTTIANSRGVSGVRWFGNAMEGGEGQEAIELVHDAVVAGYVQQAGGGKGELATAGFQAAGQTATNSLTAAAPEQADQRLGTLWASAGDAAAWATDVLGEQVISLCETCASETRGGRGLLAKVHEERNALHDQWRALLTAGDLRYKTLPELRTVSSTKVQLTQDVMLALYDLDEQDRLTYVQRLASDVAVERTMEKALAVRQMLFTAMQMPEVRGIEEASKSLQSQSDTMKEHIRELAFDIEIGRMLVSNVPAMLIAHREEKRRRAMKMPTVQPGVLGEPMIEQGDAN